MLSRRHTHRFTGIAACLAWAAMLSGNDAACGSPPGAMPDVVLQHGVLRCRVIAANNRAAADVDVIVRRGRQETARARTDARGSFTVPALDDGDYELVCGDTAGMFRVWHSTVAPPTAGEELRLVLGRRGLPGRVETLSEDATLLWAAGVVAAVIVAAVVIDRVHHLPTELPPLSNH